MLHLQPGDVIVVSTGCGFAAKAIDVAAVIKCRPALGNHVAVVHHYTDGVPWCVEGRPGGVGWHDARGYLASSRTVTNVDQPKNDAQRALITTEIEVMLHRPYDWAAIMSDTLAALDIPDLFRNNWKGAGAPGHVVCSSFAAYLYLKAGLAHPGVTAERYVTPADWDAFCLARAWVAA